MWTHKGWKGVLQGQWNCPLCNPSFSPIAVKTEKYLTSCKAYIKQQYMKGLQQWPQTEQQLSKKKYSKNSLFAILIKCVSEDEEEILVLGSKHRFQYQRLKNKFRAICCDRDLFSKEKYNEQLKFIKALGKPFESCPVAGPEKTDQIMLLRGPPCWSEGFQEPDTLDGMSKLHSRTPAAYCILWKLAKWWWKNSTAYWMQHEKKKMKRYEDTGRKYQHFLSLLNNPVITI